jgi:SAM-dependent methyltransferase
MDGLRRLHNERKFKLIEKVTPVKGLKVLDVGAGRGGDLHKWHKRGVLLTATDPDPDSVTEARVRALESGYHDVNIFEGTIVGSGYDIVCYNFSLQYIFKDYDIFYNTCLHIVDALKPGGLLVGVVPNADKILKLDIKWSDMYGNTIERGPSIGKGHIGEMILMKLSDGPYYSKGAIPEPLCYPQLLKEELCRLGMEIEEWTDFIYPPRATISDLYDQFIFRRI